MPSRKKARTARTAFTVDVPREMPVERRGEAWWLTVAGRELRLSNLTKVFWPEEGYTKGDLLAYYFNVADRIVPYLAGRPLTMKRMPDGIDGDFFYEKSAPSHTPDWLGRCPVPSEDAKGGVIDYLTIADPAGLLYVANLGCIEFHPLHSRCEDVTHPDYLFFDLDPFEPITFDDVRIVALHVRAALAALGLTGYPKTSGATGMQIFVPIEAGYTYEQARDFVGRIGRLIQREDPDRVTMHWEVKRRAGHVFIDHNMNREGANIAAVYSLRPEPGATVSTPVTWQEVEDGIHPRDFTIQTVWERFTRPGDPFEGVLHAPQDLGPALEALGLPSERSLRDAGSRRRRSAEVTERSRDPDLAEYVRKRDFSGTPEPAPGEAPGADGNSFVIHKHRATRLHYDLRLERDGALPSWAVPRGLPIVPGEKRLAVQTEVHPLEYGSFEGTIPKGHYGAGEVRIFDEGWYEPLEWTDTKVSFTLHGRRFRGLEWHLVKTRTDWLIFLASRQEAPLIDVPPSLAPMLAEGGWKPFDDPGWRFEPKLDGVRTLAYVSSDATRLVSRTGRDQTSRFPELAAIHEVVHVVNAVIDGEIVALDEEGRNSFEALQQRINLSNEKEIERIRRRIPVAMVAFDLLFLEGHDVTGLALEERRELLASVVEEDARISLPPFVDGGGKAFTASAEELGLEGVVAKRLGSRYRPGRRSPDWRKIKLTNSQDCVILGWTPGQGGRAASFGALLVGAYDGDELVWIGQVGTGFTDPTLAKLLELLRPLVRDTPAIGDPDLAAVRGATFVEPEIVCEVVYLEITRSTRKMRAPSFKGLRSDKAPADCVLEIPRRARRS
jgi:DNA ligase D-like protein (predicted ligase)/DNA ligase D-like protein (predicted polymerase)/DNA ligase D-like protein (predicted 3'-phosphoesterase)